MLFSTQSGKYAYDRLHKRPLESDWLKANEKLQHIFQSKANFDFCQRLGQNKAFALRLLAQQNGNGTITLLSTQIRLNKALSVAAERTAGN